ncbi:hypothetical protein NPIL_254031 [Nephila pilipes]|uniref:Uncharacterized protein n=1 Tax=Nephila pilipes TaxID=299642 RepID=A0A8X6N831_NEPPI|nr:hypothetical protein NPIL_254031 [Nephila pilipes]
MSRKKVFKTVEEAVEYLFSEELESEMIVLPPEVDEFTDEEGFDDSETLDPSIRDIICPIILHENTKFSVLTVMYINVAQTFIIKDYLYYQLLSGYL